MAYVFCMRRDVALVTVAATHLVKKSMPPNAQIARQAYIAVARYGWIHGSDNILQSNWRRTQSSNLILRTFQARQEEFHSGFPAYSPVACLKYVNKACSDRNCAPMPVALPHAQQDKLIHVPLRQIREVLRVGPTNREVRFDSSAIAFFFSQGR
jgi:hypothetical protein